jgi:hypothetical protein
MATLVNHITGVALRHEHQLEPQRRAEPFRRPTPYAGNSKHAATVTHDHVCPAATEPILMGDKMNFSDIGPRDAHHHGWIAFLFIDQRRVSKRDDRAPRSEYPCGH